MGAFQSLSKSGRATIWLITGVAAGVALTNWIKYYNIVKTEQDNNVACTTSSPSNNTMLYTNATFFFIFLILFLIASWYLFFSSSKTVTGLEKSGAEIRSIF
jgi:hypothetical protein